MAKYLKKRVVAKECGEDVIGDCLIAAMKLSSMTSVEVVLLLFAIKEMILIKQCSTSLTKNRCN